MKKALRIACLSFLFLWLGLLALTLWEAVSFVPSGDPLGDWLDQSLRAACCFLAFGGLLQAGALVLASRLALGKHPSPVRTVFFAVSAATNLHFGTGIVLLFTVNRDWIAYWPGIPWLVLATASLLLMLPACLPSPDQNENEAL